MVVFRGADIGDLRSNQTRWEHKQHQLAAFWTILAESHRIKIKVTYSSGEESVCIAKNPEILFQNE